ncbi:bifunctional proline dehydrogenase/L-glutamate gamma-semialdehyde dehydrogenase PutA [Lonepinella sp. MS14435]|uniref:bifunctional proline dehydrogenase/L-glutamate gamma-semialdehyde dehydrogenase PutA n=1 Tax=Lonepinella sp. MS14435 TaxID=3003618 RepID=UPI0036DDC9BF
MSYEILPKTTIRPILSEFYRIPEQKIVAELIEKADMSEQSQSIAELCKKLVSKVRADRKKASGVDALMHEFSLSSAEGIALMCLSEALLRIPDKTTADKLIHDKLVHGDWKAHLGNSPSLFVNSAAWGLIVAQKIVSHSDKELSSALSKLISKGGEPLIRQGMNVGMRLLGKQFVTGETIDAAIKNGEKRFEKGFRYSYDMLGETALTQKDADRYYNDYVNSIRAVGETSKGLGVYKSSGVSVKLSAIHPRYSLSQHQRVIDELYPKLKELFLLAKKYDIGLNIDAEEAARLELSLDLLDRLIADPDLEGFHGIGFVVQAYQKRCSRVIDHIIAQARANNRKLMIRLVKGAYWDSEVKLAQAEGATDYPVFTRKVHSDINYITCAKKLLSAQDVIYPQFATHNAQTLATVYHLAKDKHFEFQCLHGMGETLYEQVVGKENLNVQCRIYAPVGSYQTLLAYLVRRLLENGSNSSFVNQIVDEHFSVDSLAEDPVNKAKETQGTAHPKVPLPVNIYGERRNSKGYDLTDAISLQQLQTQLNELSDKQYQAKPLIVGEVTGNSSRTVYNPAVQSQIVGQVIDANEQDVNTAFTTAVNFKQQWANTAPEVRSEKLEKMADLMEQHLPELFDLAVREAGKTLNNAIAEVREAVDFCRYYAGQVRANPAGFKDPRGVVVAISPWNFPLAIFIGEVSSALVAGNVVLAKPAEQTSLMAYFAVNLFHQAGIPKEALQLLTGSGKTIGESLTTDERVNGVIFTGSTDTAKRINSNIQKHGSLIPLIAETGGQNAMIVDSSALGEQVTIDVLNSAFDSAGQRCSALRVLYLQKDNADHLLELIKGAMAELVVGNPAQLTTDVGPVIDKVAQQRLLDHIEVMKKQAKSCYQVPIAKDVVENGIFVAPTLLEIDNINQLKHEVFGPVLHVIRYDAEKLDDVIREINSTGFGLTCGLHSRIDQTQREWEQGIQAGNLYANRNIVGAVVGVQPFGGQGLSGTGPKAGGALYLQRLNNRTAWNFDGLTEGITPNISEFSTALNQVLTGDELAQAQQSLQTLSASSPLGKIHQMHGVTGENNFLRFEPRGEIAIGDGDLFQQVLALVAIVAAGSRGVVRANSPLAQHANKLSKFITVVNDFNSLDQLSQLIVLNPLSQAEKSHYAERNGAIMTFVENLALAQSLLPLMHEKSVSINTAAMGGNASLMAAMD